MKQKGFTLIELLAVIVILAIIAVITVPMIMNVIDKAKLGALEDSAYGLIESANLYYSENVQNLTNTTTFDFVEGKQTSDSKLTYKGSIDSGKLILTIEGKVVVCIDDGTNYAYKDLNETKVKSGKGTCSYNGETGSFDIISDVGALNQELSDLKKIGNALSSEILEGKTALVGGIEVTGTMKNNSEKILSATTVISENANLYFKIPEDGYYDTNSLIGILNESSKQTVLGSWTMSGTITKKVTIGSNYKVVIATVTSMNYSGSSNAGVSASLSSASCPYVDLGTNTLSGNGGGVYTWSMNHSYLLKDVKSTDTITGSMFGERGLISIIGIN